ncbi:MAG: hypothetical protein VX181_13705, partial [Pseudomonadota bacterium]|nr:hypothetical protein [Pseudomonadota bacterium]
FASHFPSCLWQVFALWAKPPELSPPPWMARFLAHPCFRQLVRENAVSEDRLEFVESENLFSDLGD